jgi:hypothetical protein
MFAAIGPYAGHQPFNDWFEPDTVQRMPLGTTIDAVDPYWGAGQFIYVKSDDTIIKGSVCTFDIGAAGELEAILHPNTANLGLPVGVAMAPMTAGKYGWLQISGLAVYKTNATVAAGTAVGITAAGILGANSAGKQMLGVRNLRAATATASLTGTQTQSGSGKLFRPAGYDGAFLGAALSGTGVPGSTVVAGLDPDGKTILMGSAVGTFDRTATATGIITLTVTYTGFGAGFIAKPNSQGAIT